MMKAVWTVLKCSPADGCIDVTPSIIWFPSEGQFFKGPRWWDGHGPAEAQLND